MDARARSGAGAIAGAMAALEAGRIEGVRFEDADVGADVRIAAKEHDRYLAVTGAERGGGREEWRSGRWIRTMLERGHWTVLGSGAVPSGSSPAAAGAAPPDWEATDLPAGSGIRIRRPLRGGFVEMALPYDVTPEEARAALVEVERLSTLLRTLS